MRVTQRPAPTADLDTAAAAVLAVWHTDIGVAAGRLLARTRSSGHV